LLALVALAGRLAVPRSGAAADALALLAGALGGPEVREVHDFTISTRCGIFAAMPRTDGVSGYVRTRPSFSSPSARRIFFCGSGKPMPLRTCLILMVFFDSGDILRSVLHFFGGLAAKARDALRILEHQEPGHRRAHHVVRIRAAQRLRQHVLDPQ